MLRVKVVPSPILTNMVLFFVKFNILNKLIFVYFVLIFHTDPNDEVEFVVGEKSNRHSENEEEIDPQSSAQEPKLDDDNTNEQDEKKILKKEINSLNAEIKSMLKRIKSTEEG